MGKKLEYEDIDWSNGKGWSRIGPREGTSWGWKRKGVVTTPQGRVEVSACKYEGSGCQDSILFMVYGNRSYRREFKKELSPVSLARQAFKFAREVAGGR
jgi:hypothetical protein